MYMIKKLSTLCILCLNIFVSLNVYSQTVADSLFKVYKSAKHDTARVSLLLAIGDQIFTQDPDSAEKIFKQCLHLISNTKKTSDPIVAKTFKQYGAYADLNLAYIQVMHGDIAGSTKMHHQCMKVFKELNDDYGLGSAYSNYSQIQNSIGQNDTAIVYAQKALKLFKKINNENMIATTLNNIAFMYTDKGDISKALEIYFESLKLSEKIKNEKGIAYINHNIGGVYQSQKELGKALEYYQKALKLREKMNDKFGMAESYNTIGTITKQNGDMAKALEYYNKALDIYKLIEDPAALAAVYNNIGSLHNANGDKKKAAEYLEKCQEIQLRIQDKNGLTFSYNNLGSVYYSLKQYDKAISYTQKSLKLSEELGYPDNIKSAAQQLFLLYNEKGDFRLALDNYQLYIKMRDSINNLETQRSAIKLQANYEYQQKKAIADTEHKLALTQQEEKANSEKNKQQVVIASVSVVLVLVLVFSIFLYNRFKITQKQKAIIELKEKETNEQKLIIEEKHKEITDSINYAERIQRSFMATKDVLDINLTKNKGESYFILFKPKSIVSGDFYWASTLPNGNFAFVTADSTGHGVPGAIMSLLNITSLEKAIEKHNDPGDILNHARETIINRLKKDGSLEGGKDGMDCSIVVFDFKKNLAKIASANNPVWIVRHNGKTNSMEVIEISPDKMPVGKSDKQQHSFKSHEIELISGDMIYTFTDGFADQFGGPLGKKFMSKNLRSTLIANAHLPVYQQKELLQETFTKWIGALEQIDDVTLVGIRV